MKEEIIANMDGKSKLSELRTQNKISQMLKSTVDQNPQKLGDPRMLTAPPVINITNPVYPM